MICTNLTGVLLCGREAAAHPARHLVPPQPPRLRRPLHPAAGLPAVPRVVRLPAGPRDLEGAVEHAGCRHLRAADRGVGIA